MDGQLIDEPTKKLSDTKQAEIVKEVRERVEDSWSHDRDNRREAATDLAFLAGNQWPEQIRREREAESRPMLTINRLPQFVRQITNDIRQADLAIKVAPVDDKSDPKLAKIYDGLIRQIQYQSSANHVFATAAEHQTACGIGWFRVCTEYCNDQSFDQELRLKAIRNPLSVYDDPGAIEPDRSDANWRAIVEVWPLSAFKQQWPDAAQEGVDVPVSDANSSSFFWSASDYVRVAEYWRKVPETIELAYMEDGSTINLTDVPKELRMMLPTPVRTRQHKTHRLECYIVSGSQVLSGPHSWHGRMIPIVPVIGGEWPMDQKTYRYGAIRFAREPQQLYNYYRTATAEAIALAPKAPYIATAAMIGPHKAMWDRAGKTNQPYLIYDPDPDAPGAAPRREHPPELPSALIQEAQIASDDMKGTTGIYDSALGAKSNETSGVAIGRRQTESDTAQYHFVDNLQRSLEYCGRILIEVIPKIYDNERVVRLLGEDDQEEFVTINQATMGVDGVPVMINDLSAATFDVRVKIGKSYTNKRQEAADSMLAFMQSYPPSAPLIGDLVAKNLDWPGADEIAKRLRNAVPPNILFDPSKPQEEQEQGPPQPPDPAIEMAQATHEMEMQKGQMELQKTQATTDAQIQKMQAEVQIKQAELEIEKARLAIEMQRLQIEKDKAELSAATARHQARLSERQQTMAEDAAHEAREPAETSQDD